MHEDAHLEAEYEDRNGAPHGEEQANIDWLESRGDQDSDPADWDDEGRYDGSDDGDDGSDL